ncbi:MAG: YraN family protein [Acutalibacteraceae bacterium]
MNKSNINGVNGETLAAKFLVKKGYEIAALNYRCRQGEIDIIADDDEYILFVEVKSRNENALYLPREAVDEAKQKKIILTALQYLAATGIELQPRFDVLEVYSDSKNPNKAKINHIKNAFSAEGYF